MKKQWHIRDIIDLEYLMEQDKDIQTEKERSAIRERDRQIFLDAFSETAAQDEKPDHQRLLAAWLANRRQEAEAAATFLPGPVIEEVDRSVRFFFCLFGIIIGVSATFSLLAYTGEKPVNVFYYLTFFVLVQILMVVALALILIIKKLGRSFFSFGLLYSISARLMIKLFRKGAAQVSDRISTAKMRRMEALIGLLKNRRQTYGSLFYWPIFLLFQLFGICFNIAVLLSSLFLVTISDIAFGWQSTIQLSSQAVHDFVRTLALPWSWLTGSARAYPSLEEIEGSRIILKDALYSLVTADLVSWWPFLVFSVLVYGLIPRLFLFVLGGWAKRRVLKQQPFDQNIFSSLIRRMTNPIVNSSGLQDPPELVQDNLHPVSRIPSSQKKDAATTVLVPDDLFEQCTDDELGRHLLNSLGLSLKEKIRIDADYQAEQLLIQKLGSMVSKTKQSILILTEGWMAPIEDFFSLVKNLRRAIGETCPIYIGLLGKPGKTTIFTPAAQLDFQVWQQKVNSLGDPYLSLEPIIGLEEKQR